MAHDFFLSYRRADKAFARSLVEEITARGATIWWDEMIPAGVDWRDAIADNLNSAEVIIILFSEACNDSKQLRKELALADDLNKMVIPVLIEDTKPKGHFLFELAARNWIQAFPEAERKIDSLSVKLLEIVGYSLPKLQGLEAWRSRPPRPTTLHLHRSHRRSQNVRFARHVIFSPSNWWTCQLCWAHHC